MQRHFTRPQMVFASLVLAALLLLFVSEEQVGALRARALSALSPVLELTASRARSLRERETPRLVPAASNVTAGGDARPTTSGGPTSASGSADSARPATEGPDAPDLEDRQQQLLAEIVRLQNEVSRLRKLLPDQASDEPRAGAAEPPPGIPARVLARKVLWQEPILALNRGQAEGVRLHAGVMSRGAVAGRIVSVGPHAACMALLTHKGMCVGARLVDSRVEGVLQGMSGPANADAEALCRLSVVARELDAKPGEQVVSSGYDGAFPPGLWLGTVTEVKKRGDLQWELTVRPACAENTLEGVRILTVPTLDAPWPAARK